MIAIINYGIGNLASIQNIIKHIGGTAQITDDIEVLKSAKLLILPGVGSFDSCLQALRKSQLLPTVEQRVHNNKTPILGICVGLQMMAEKSEEGTERGLGWVAGRVIKLRPDPGTGLKVPHLGWRPVHSPLSSPLSREIGSSSRFYFAHSYHIVPDDDAVVAATSDYGGQFVAAISKQNISAVQFHPEKSHRFGMQFFRTYLAAVGALAVRRYDAI